jgi:hypothetical protein
MVEWITPKIKQATLSYSFSSRSLVPSGAGKFRLSPEIESNRICMLPGEVQGTFGKNPFCIDLGDQERTAESLSAGYVAFARLLKKEVMKLPAVSNEDEPPVLMNARHTLNKLILATEVCAEVFKSGQCTREEDFGNVSTILLSNWNSTDGTQN